MPFMSFSELAVIINSHRIWKENALNHILRLQHWAVQTVLEECIASRATKGVEGGKWWR